MQQFKPRTLIIQVPMLCSEGSKPSVSLPLGLLHLAAVIKEECYIRMWDGAIPQEPTLFFEDDSDRYFGKSWRLLEEELKGFSPEIILLSAPFSSSRSVYLCALKTIRRVLPDALVVVGGAHATVSPEDFLLSDYKVDIVCLGEGETVLSEIVSRYKKGLCLRQISGTAILEKSEVKYNARQDYIIELDSLPYPDFDLLDIEKYFKYLNKGYESRPSFSAKKNKRSVSIVTSRGCPYSCSFCPINVHMGSRWRKYSAEYIVKYINYLKKRYKINYIHFEDDNINFDKERFQKIIKHLKKTKIAWGTPNGLRLDLLDRSTIKQISKTKCEYLIFGIESGSEKVRNDIIEKQLSDSKIIEISKLTKKYGINAKAFYIIGFPDEKKRDIIKTLSFALYMFEKYDVFPSLNILMPLKSTKVRKECIRNNYIEDKDIVIDPYKMIKNIEQKQKLKVKFLLSRYEFRLKEKLENKVLNYLSKRQRRVNKYEYHRKRFREDSDYPGHSLFQLMQNYKCI